MTLILMIGKMFESNHLFYEDATAIVVIQEKLVWTIVANEFDGIC